MKSKEPVFEHEKCAQIATRCACFNFRKASRAITQLFDAALAPTGMRSTQFTVLIGLALSKSIGISALADMLAIDRTTLTRSLKPLLRQGYVGFVPAKDRRTRAVALLAKGRRALENSFPHWEIAQSQVVERYGPNRWSGLMTDLEMAVSLGKGK